MTIEDGIRNYIASELQPSVDVHELTDDYPLLERHVIDSMGIYELVNYLEYEFAVKVEDEDLVVEHFGTIRDIARLVESKRRAAAERPGA